MSGERPLDPEYRRDDEQNMIELERKALEEVRKLPDVCLPTAQYLQKFVLPYVMHALKVTAKQRSKNPVQFFSYYLLAQRNI